MLHIRCGDDILPKLAGLPGDTMRWADPLCEGPVPGGLAPEAFRAHRAGWLADRLGLDRATVAADLARQDANLDQAAGQDEVVLWFEHDLFDQIILIHLLHRLAPVAAAGTRVSLVNIGAHPAVPRFIGLGQLDADQLAALFPQRAVVTAAQFALAVRAWAAYTAADPQALLRLWQEGTAALPFLGAALHRHFQEFPSTRDGLSRTERLTLEAVAAGSTAPWEVFRAVQAHEPAPWQGDLFFMAVLNDLAAGPAPLLSMAAGQGATPWTAVLALSGQGRAVLGSAPVPAGRSVERWRGGVHLAGTVLAWRWDEDAGTLVPG